MFTAAADNAVLLLLHYRRRRRSGSRRAGGRATYVPRSLPDRPAAPTSLTDAAAEGGGLPTAAAACLSCRDRFVPPISDQGISTDGFNQRIL